MILHKATHTAGPGSTDGVLQGPHRVPEAPPDVASCDSVEPLAYHDVLILLEGALDALTTALDARDPVTFGHSERVARMAVAVGKQLQLSRQELGSLYLAGLLHDVGKIGIRDTILGKPDDLTPDEHDHMRRHVQIGYWILAGLRPIRHLVPAVLHHHERVDGQGYPEGLRQEQIPRLSRILSVVDAFDAMTHPRPYRSSLPIGEVEATIRQGSGSQWDAEVVEAFFECRAYETPSHHTPLRATLREAIHAALSRE